MGADLYVMRLNRDKQIRGFEISKRAVDAGYFRDGYNSYGLFPFLTTNLGRKFSWQGLRKEKAKWFNKADEMHARAVPEFLAIIRTAQEEIRAKIDEKQKLIIRDFMPGGSERISVILTKEQIKDFTDHLDLLIRFCELAIARKSEIQWDI